MLVGQQGLSIGGTYNVTVHGLYEASTNLLKMPVNLFFWSRFSDSRICK